MDSSTYVFILLVMCVVAVFFTIAALYWRKESPPTFNETISAVGLIFVVFGTIILFLVVESNEQLTFAIGMLGAIAGYLFGSSQMTTSKEAFVDETKKLEDRISENKKDTEAVWKLAYKRMEFYIARNLKDVRSVYYLSVISMVVGFSLVIFGVYNLYIDPNNINAPLLSAVSGVIVNFVGATFLVLYKSTMSQAQKYMSILERVNAVGMSMKIIEAMDDEHKDLKQETSAGIAKELLQLYKDIKT